MSVEAALLGAARQSVDRPRTERLAGTAAVVLLGVGAMIAVRATGGSPNALNNMGYAAVVLGAYLAGARGGIAAGLLVVALLGPIAELTGMPNEGLQGWLIRGTFFVGVGAATGAAIDHVRAVAERWRRTAISVVEREEEGMLALARGAEAKDTDTGEHIRRVQLTSEALARAAGIRAEAAVHIGYAAMLHDVGKLHVPDGILNKPGPLDPDEWAIMRQHPRWGEEILGEGEGFALARLIARTHHENLDGSGYPDGLRGERIPLEGRIVRITDAFDAMTNRRPYAAGRSFEEALEELDRCKGTLFDPELVALMVELVRRSEIAAQLERLASPRFG